MSTPKRRKLTEAEKQARRETRNRRTVELILEAWRARLQGCRSFREALDATADCVHRLVHCDEERFVVLERALASIDGLPYFRGQGSFGRYVRACEFAEALLDDGAIKSPWDLEQALKLAKERFTEELRRAGFDLWADVFLSENYVELAGLLAVDEPAEVL